MEADSTRFFYISELEIYSTMIPLLVIHAYKVYHKHGLKWASITDLHIHIFFAITLRQVFMRTLGEFPQ